ncbi:MAG: hypothetical protein RIC06_00860 [Cyclobacteriaceae bacterium]
MTRFVAEACATTQQFPTVVYLWRITMVCEPQTMDKVKGVSS